VITDVMSIVFIEDAIVSGWGKKSKFDTEDEEFPNILQTASTIIISNKECIKRLRNINVSETEQTLSTVVW
jgi:hypothetical protein